MVGSDYDVLYPGVESENEAAVDLLARLAGECEPHACLEFGIGTGRLALSIAERGISVTGIDGSETIIEQLRKKSRARSIHTVIGDYRYVKVDARFSLVLLTLNGIFDPRGRRAQIEIFENAARHLVSGGHFVVESWVMNDAQRSGSWGVIPRYVGTEHVELQLARYELETNRIQRMLVHLRPEGLKFVEVFDTYASPGELDLMGEVSGFRRVARWADWCCRPFTASSQNQISVFQLK